MAASSDAEALRSGLDGTFDADPAWLPHADVRRRLNLRSRVVLV